LYCAPGEEIVAIDVTPRPELLLDVRQHLGDVSVVVQQKETPRAVVGTWLFQHRHLHDASILRRLGGVAERGVRVAQGAEGGRVEGRRDCALSVVHGLFRPALNRGEV
jgi:hypothetical protein